MKTLFWKGYSRAHYQHALPELPGLIDGDGDVVEVKRFSDPAVSLKIEAEARQVAADAREFCAAKQRLGSGVALLLNVTFALGSGKVKTEVPEVNG